MRPIPALEGFVVGLSLVAIGAVWTLANFGRLDMLATLRTWWPSVLVLWGLLELYNWRARSTRAPEPPRPSLLDRAEDEAVSGRTE